MNAPRGAPPGPAGGPDEVEARVAAWCRGCGVLESGTRVVVACSGGADSVALLLTLGRLPLSLHAVHVDHGLRSGSEAEAALVRAAAAAVGASAETVRVSVPTAGNRMAAAREARYAALVARAEAAAASVVAVGHTATDQAETVAFRQQRGDSPAAHALAGMPLLRPLTPTLTLVRPLAGAGVDRAAARALVVGRGLTPFDDPSNAETRFTRVRLRGQLLAAPPEDTAALLALSASCALVLERDEETARALGDPGDLEAAEVAAATPEVVVRLLRRAGHLRPRLVHARALIGLCLTRDGSRGLDVGGGLRAERRYDRLSIAAPAPPPPPVAVLADGPGLYRVSDRLVQLRLDDGAAVDDRGIGLDAGLSPWPLWLRSVRAGDRLRRPAGHRKVHDLLIDAKVPRAARAGLLVVAPGAGSEVLWVEGVGGAVGGGRAFGPRLVVSIHEPTA